MSRQLQPEKTSREEEEQSAAICEIEGAEQKYVQRRRIVPSQKEGLYLFLETGIFGKCKEKRIPSNSQED